MLAVSDPIAWLIPCFLSLAIAEFLLTRRRSPHRYCPRDVKATLILGTGCALSNALCTGTFLALGAWLGQDGPLSALSRTVQWPLALVLVDLAYYWAHRAGHRVQLFWATHSVHHSSRHFNFTVALRNGWTGPLYPMAMLKVLLLALGLPLSVLVTALAVVLTHQVLIHTECVGRLPWLVETIFNTPSHHRVHHGAYIDRNFGGMLIRGTPCSARYRSFRRRLTRKASANPTSGRAGATSW